MRRLFLAIAIGLFILIAYTRCEQAPEPVKPKLKEVELIDDYGTHFKGWLDEGKFIPRQQIFDANGRINGTTPCVAPGCGQNGGKQVCCAGTGSCWYC